LRYTENLAVADSATASNTVDSVATHSRDGSRQARQTGQGRRHDIDRPQRKGSAMMLATGLASLATVMPMKNVRGAWMFPAAYFPLSDRQYLHFLLA